MASKTSIPRETFDAIWLSPVRRVGQRVPDHRDATIGAPFGCLLVRSPLPGPISSRIRSASVDANGSEHPAGCASINHFLSYF